MTKVDIQLRIHHLPAAALVRMRMSLDSAYVLMWKLAFHESVLRENRDAIS